LLTIKTCLHKSFLSQPRFIDAVITGFKTCVFKLKENSESAELQEFLSFCASRIEIKSSAIDKSVVVASSNPINEKPLKQPAFASADKNRANARSDNKFMKDSLVADTIDKQDVSEDEEETKKIPAGGPRKKVSDNGDLEPSMIGKKRI
jgi:hypothetical protein